MLGRTPFFTVLMMLLCATLAFAQQPAQTCKDNAGRCDKELLLLRGEVDNKRQAIAVLLDANEQWQTRAEKAEASLKEQRQDCPPVLSGPLIPATPKD